MSNYGTGTPNSRPLIYDVDIHVKISGAQHEKLHQIAEYTGQPFSRVIREAIDEAIEVFDRARGKR